MRVLTIAPEALRVEDVDLTYDWLKDIVQGWLGVVNIEWPDGRRATLYVDDEFKLRGSSANESATRLAHHFGAIFSDDWIGGTCVLVGTVDQEGDDTELPEEMLCDALRAITDHTLTPVTVAPTFWQWAAEAVGAGIPVIVTGAPSEFQRPTEGGAA